MNFFIKLFKRFPKGTDIKMGVWRSKYQEVCEVIADQEYRLAIIEHLGEDEIVGQQETGKSMGMAGKRDVKAKEARESLQSLIKENTNRKEALEKLMGI